MELLQDFNGLKDPFWNPVITLHPCNSSFLALCDAYAYLDNSVYIVALLLVDRSV